MNRNIVKHFFGHCLLIDCLFAAVILMEGGAEDDLKILDEPDDDLDSSRGRKDSENADKK